MSVTEVRKAQRALTEAVARVERLRAARDAAVIAALDARVRQSEIMAATGLSRGRLDQIRRGTR